MPVSEIPKEVSEDVRQVFGAETVSEVADNHGVSESDVWTALARSEIDGWPIGGIRENSTTSVRNVDESRLIYDDHYSGVDEWALEAGLSDDVQAAVQDVFREVADGYERWDGDRVEECRPMVIVGDYRDPLNVENGKNSDSAATKED